MAKKEVALQPVDINLEAATSATLSDNRIVVKGAIRRSLPKRRNSKTYKFRIADLKGYFTVGEYDDGTPGELFISVSKQGSTLSGLMDSFAIAVSHGLQYGVPLKSYVRTLMSTGFAPSGITDDEEIRTSSSITDYICRRLALDYLSFDDRLELGLASLDDIPDQQTTLLTDDQSVTGQLVENGEKTISLMDLTQENPASFRPAFQALDESSDDKGIETGIVHDSTTIVSIDNNAPLCYNCGNQTQRSGSCYVCTSCGSTTGCS
jgi:ribonucleoside-diphosphate reductase alpha chain